MATGGAIRSDHCVTVRGVIVLECFVSLVTLGRSIREGEKNKKRAIRSNEKMDIFPINVSRLRIADLRHDSMSSSSQDTKYIDNESKQ